MTLKIIISSAVVCAFITLIGNIISAKIAQKTATKTAKQTASSEIEKMQLTWSREDLVTSDDEFADMASEVARYIQNGTSSQSRDALAKVAAVRSKESGAIGDTLDMLYSYLRLYDRDGADQALSLAIRQKRELKGTKTSD